MKILILIIASDELEVYRQEQIFWRLYMNSHKDIDSFFIKGKTTTNKKKEKDELYFETEESLEPGIINKTLMALKSFEFELDKYDYIIRTNLSSFYVFNLLVEYLEKQPRTNFYSGVIYQKEDYRAISGAGIIMSNDVVKLLLLHYDELYNNKDLPDDSLIGRVLCNIKAVETPRENIACVQEIPKIYKNNFFHYRVKQIYFVPECRTEPELYILKLLYNKFYGPILGELK